VIPHLSELGHCTAPDLFLQEDAPDEIGHAIADWLRQLDQGAGHV